VEDLLALARGDERAPLRLGLHDLDALAAAAAGAAEVASGGRPSVRHVPADGPVQARFDRERLEQAVAILLDNAVKYTAEWGKVSVSTTRRDSGVMLEVSDTGNGIPEEDLPYVFERFYRADETRAARGAGLGLSIARQIAEAHGGSLSVESEAGEGSTFTLRLPRNGPPASRD